MFKSHEPLTETKILAALKRAKYFEQRRQFDDELSELSEFWAGTDDPPQVDNLSQQIQGEIWLRCGTVLSWLSNFKQVPTWLLTARDWLTKSQDIFKGLGNTELLAESEVEIAANYWREGDAGNAAVWLASARNHRLSFFSELHVKVITNSVMICIELGLFCDANILINLNDNLIDLCGNDAVKIPYFINSARVRKHLGDLPRAIALYEKALDYADRHNDHLTLAFVENNIGNIYADLEEFSKAIEYSTRSLVRFKALGDLGRQAGCLDSQAQIYAKTGNLARALECINESIDILKNGDEYATLTSSMWTKALLLIKLNRTIQANQIFHELISIVRVRISEAATLSYYEQWDKMFHPIQGQSYEMEVNFFRRKIVEAALESSGNKITAAAKKLGISHQRLRKDLAVHHPELNKSVPLKQRTTRKAGKKQNRNEATLTVNNIPLALPVNLNPVRLIRVGSNRLNYLGLNMGTLAICVNQVNKKLPVVALDTSTSEIHMGFADEFSGIIGLLADNSDPVIIDSANAQILGAIAGYCKLNEAGDQYDYFKLEL